MTSAKVGGIGLLVMTGLKPDVFVLTVELVGPAPVDPGEPRSGEDASTGGAVVLACSKALRGSGFDQLADGLAVYEPGVLTMEEALSRPTTSL